MLPHNFDNIKIVLASQSPRRAELLKNLGLNFTTCAAQVDETINLGLPHNQIVQTIALKKVKAVQPTFPPDTLIIGGDTIVCCGEQIFGKPKTPQEATYMLQCLSNRYHSVMSSVCVCYKGSFWLDYDTAYIHFLPLSQQDIAYYTDTYAPYDKAGAYGIQEWIGMRAIDKIEGSFYTVMGFPTHMLCNILEKIKL